jgi:hypothetical protein
MPGSQYWMIIFIIFLIILWFTLKQMKIRSIVLLFYFLLVNAIMTWSLFNDQLAFEDAFAIGHINSSSAILLVQEIYLSYYLLVCFNCLFGILIIFGKYLFQKKSNLKIQQNNSV